MKTKILLLVFLLVLIGYQFFNNQYVVGVADMSYVDIKIQDRNTEFIFGEMSFDLYKDNKLIARRCSNPLVLGYGQYQVKVLDQLYKFDVIKDRQTVLVKTDPNPFASTFNLTGFGYEYTSVVLDMPTVLQKPELPNGCEIVAFTGLLKQAGFDVNKLDVAAYLPKEDFTYTNNKKYGGHPEKVYIGDPSLITGWYCFDGPIKTAAAGYFHDNTIDKKLVNTNSIESAVDVGKAVAVWTTLELGPVNYSGGWYLEDGSYYEAITNIHCVIVYGYDQNDYYVMDPLKGKIKREKDQLNKSVESLGNRILKIK